MGPKMAQNALFHYFSELFSVFLLKQSSSQYSFTMGHGLKFPAKKIFFFARQGFQGVQKQPKLAQNCIFVKIYLYTPICWDIFHKLPLNNMLIAIKVAFYLIALNKVMGPNMAQNCPFNRFQ